MMELANFDLSDLCFPAEYDSHRESVATWTDYGDQYRRPGRCRLPTAPHDQEVHDPGRAGRGPPPPRRTQRPTATVQGAAATGADRTEVAVSQGTTGADRTETAVSQGTSTGRERRSERRRFIIICLTGFLLFKKIDPGLHHVDLYYVLCLNKKNR